jgi:hypothetical protein
VAGRKFRVRAKAASSRITCCSATVEYLAEEPALAIGISDEHQELVDILRELIKHPMIEKLKPRHPIRRCPLRGLAAG